MRAPGSRPGQAASQALDRATEVVADKIPADEKVADVEWLTRAGTEGWAVLMKDERIRYRPAERAAVLTAKVEGFCLVKGNLRAAAMADIFISAIEDIATACQSPGPYLYAVSTTGLRRVEL